MLIEKPLASSLEDCDAMLAVARETGKKIGIISQRRFYAPCLRLKAAIDAGQTLDDLLANAAPKSAPGKAAKPAAKKAAKSAKKASAKKPASRTKKAGPEARAGDELTA